MGRLAGAVCAVPNAVNPNPNKSKRANVILRMELLNNPQTRSKTQPAREEKVYTCYGEIGGALES
jgi:hypothetical protein